MHNEILINISVILLKECEKWSAQGLEHDIAAQGESPAEAVKAFEHCLLGHVILDLRARRKPLHSIPKAPEEYWSLRDRSPGLVNPRPKPIPLPTPKANISVSRTVLAFA